MPNDYFRFKQFTVHQGACAMKVGTDGVLLGAWAGVQPPPQRILDVGTGTGLIALMLAQRAPAAQLHAVELDPAAAAQARRNAARSPWARRITVQCDDFARYARSTPLRYDLIVCNPPYFHHALLPPHPARAAARHTGALGHEALLRGSLRLLTPHGRLAVVLPCAEGTAFAALAAAAGLHCCRRLSVSTTPGRPPVRLLLELTRACAGATTPDEPPLCIASTTPGAFTPAYRALTGEFYLAL